MAHPAAHPLHRDAPRHGAARHPRPVRWRRRSEPSVEALAWGTLVLLTFGPLIGWLLATLL